MLIKELTLKGWRSYSHTEGINLKNFSKLNLIVGPNNVGKSNLMKYISFLREIIPEGNEDFTPLTVSSCHAEKKDTWLEEEEEITSEFILEQLPQAHMRLLSDSEQAKLRLSHDLKNNQTSFSILNKLRPLKPMYTNNVVASIFWKHFMANHVRYIGDIRGFNHNKTGSENIHIDGKNILDYLNEKVDDGTNWLDKYRFQMKSWLARILNEEDLDFVFTSGSNPTFSLILKAENGKEITMIPRQLGSGVTHLVLILTVLYACKHQETNIFIEEPETNLHPSAVIELCRIFENEFPKHRFFIFTHSTVWLDQMNENLSIYQFYKATNSSTKVLNCTEDIHFYNMFECLGIRPSQLLLSNFIIWIEGPSDRIYLKHWIDKFSKDCPLIEGKHYTFAMYGGTNLSQYDLVFNDLINMLSTGYNLAIICDSDLSERRDSIKDRVKKIQSKIVDKQISSRVMLWVTKGREIENYVPHDLFVQVLNSSFKKHYVRLYNRDISLYKKVVVSNGGMKKVRMNFPRRIKRLSLTWEFGKLHSYDDFFIDLYTFNDKKVQEIFKDMEKNKKSLRISKMN